MRIDRVFDPKKIYKPEQTSTQSDESPEFTARGKTLAAGLSAVSTGREGLFHWDMFMEALEHESDLPLREEILELAEAEKARQKHARTYRSDPAPPLGDASPLKDLPTAQLQRPILMVPGWDMAHDRFMTLTEKLTESGGQAFYVKSGEFFSDRDCTVRVPALEVPADSKVFVTVLEHLGESPHTSSPQIEANLSAIRTVTGQPKSDVFAYSQGGLATRHFLDTTEVEIGKFLMLGTPNMGSGMADVSKFLYNAQDQGYDVDFLMEIEHLDIDDEAAIRFMATDSPELADLNSRWTEQMADTEGFLVVGSDQDWTLTWGLPPLGAGDTIVERENLTPEGVEPFLISDGDWVDHRNLPYNAEVYQQMLAHFNWHPTNP